MSLIENNNNKIINRRDFLKFGVAPFFFSGDNKNSRNFIIISPKNTYLETLKIKLRSYSIFLNDNQSFGLEIETQSELPFDHCNYHQYNDLQIFDIENNKILFFNNIYFEWADIKLRRVFRYGYNHCDDFFEQEGLFA